MSGMCGLTKLPERRPAARAKPRTRDVRVERQVRRHSDHPSSLSVRVSIRSTAPDARMSSNSCRFHSAWTRGCRWFPALGGISTPAATAAALRLCKRLGQPAGQGSTRARSIWRSTSQHFSNNSEASSPKRNHSANLSSCRNPCPELVHLATEVHDGCRDLRPRHPRLVRGDQSKDAGDEVIGGWIDLYFGRDAVPRAPLFICKANPH